VSSSDDEEEKLAPHHVLVRSVHSEFPPSSTSSRLSIMFCWKEDGWFSSTSTSVGGRLFLCTGTFLSCNRYCTLTAQSPMDAA